MRDESKAVTVNGESRRTRAVSVRDLLRELGYDAEGRGLAVAIDGAVVPRSRWDEAMLRDGLRIDVVSAVQGG